MHLVPATSTRKLKQYTYLMVLCSAVFSGCSEDTPKTAKLSENLAPQSSQATTSSKSELELSADMARFITTIDQHYRLLIKEADKLNQTLLEFAQKPSNEGLSTSLNNLNKTHSLYSSNLILMKCCIDMQLIESPEHQLEPGTLPALSKLDQYPLLPGYLDSVKGYPYSGLIYSDIPITTESLTKEFQLGDPAYVTFGFHALETILKGGSGDRKITDFAPIESIQDSESAPAELRRTLYAILLASEIKKDIISLQQHWLSKTKPKLSLLTDEQTTSFFKQLDSIILKELDVLEKSKHDEHLNSEDKHKMKEFLDQLRSIEDPQ